MLELEEDVKIDNLKKVVKGGRGKWRKKRRKRKRRKKRGVGEGKDEEDRWEEKENQPCNLRPPLTSKFFAILNQCP